MATHTKNPDLNFATAHWPWLLGLVYAAVAYLLAARTFTIDALYYLSHLRAENGNLLIYPHHLLLEVVYQRARLFPGHEIAFLQAVTALATAGGVVVFARAVRRVMESETAAFATAVWLGACNILLAQATMPDAGPLFWFFVSVNFAWAIRLFERTPGPRTAALLTLTTVLGILFHQSLVLALPVLAGALALNSPRDKRERLVGAMVVGTGIGVGAAYLLAAVLATGSIHPARLWQWITSFRSEFATSYGSFSLLFSLQFLRGLGSSLISGEPFKAFYFHGHQPGPELIKQLIPVLVLGLLMAGGALGFLMKWRHSETRVRRQLGTVSILALIAGLFAAWWDPAQPKFWIPVLPALILAIAWGWSRLAPRRAAPAILLCAALTVAWNFGFGVVPRHRTDDANQPLVGFLKNEVGPQGVVIIREDRVWQCATLFAPESRVFGIPSPRSDRWDYSLTVWHTAVAAAESSLARGERVWVVDGQLEELTQALGPVQTQPVLNYHDSDLGPGTPDQILFAVMPR